MTKARASVKELLRNLLYADLGLALVIFGQYYLSGGKAAILRSLVLLPLFFVTIPMRNIHHRLWRFILPCLAYLYALYWLGRLLPSAAPEAWLAELPFLDMAQRVFFTLFGAYALLLTIYERFTKPAGITMGLLVATEALMVFLYLNAPAASALRVALHLLAVFHLMFYVIHMQMENFESAMFRYAESDKQPVDRISRLGNRLLLVFVAFLGGVALLAPYGAAIANAVLRGVLAVIRFFAGFLDFDHGEETPPTTAPMTEPTEGGGGGLPAAEPSAFMKILSAIIEFFLQLIMIAFVIAVIVGFFYLLYRLYRRFYTDRSQDGDVRIRLARTRSVATRAPGAAELDRRRPRRGFGVSPAERIRRLFLQTVERTVKAGRATIRNSDTAEIISDKVGKGLRRDIGPLTEIYEKARYGPEGAVDREDVKNAAAISKGN